MGYTVLSNVRHDGVTYEPGQVIADMSEDQAKPLIADGILESLDDEPAANVDEPPAQPNSEVTPPADETQQPPADPEAPATDAPLGDDQPTQPDASSQGSDDELSIEDQVKVNIAKDKAASEKLAQEPGKPAQPSASDIQKDIADV